MTFSITIDPTDPHGSDHSLSDEEDSSGVQVSVPSDPGSHEYQDYDEWAHLPYPDELKPSDSASRPRTSHRSRPLHGTRSASGRRQTSRRHMIPERESFGPRARRHHSPESPDSADSAEEYAGPFGRAAPDRRMWPPPAPGYAPSSSSGPSYNAYPHGPGPYMHPNGPQNPSDQLIRLGHPNSGQQPAYGSAAYPYGTPYPPPHGSSMHPYFPQEHPAHSRHAHRQQPPQPRNDAHNPSQPPIPHPMAPHGSPSPFAGSPFHSHELMPYGPAGYYNYRDPYAMVPGMMPPSYFPSYPQVPSPTQPESKSPPEPPADIAKDEAIARLEKLILDERTERETREAAQKAAIEREAAEKAAQEERAAHDKQIAEQAAALARADAEKKAAEDAAKAKEEAEKAAAAAASEAAASAAAAATEAANAAAAEAAKKTPAEKKKPIKFKDAVGRKFSFPFELCSTWQVSPSFSLLLQLYNPELIIDLTQGMEELIRQAFLHIEVIGPHVAEGHYDLIGPNGDIILPQVWETVIEPDWAITMHMWPIPEKPKEPDPPAAEAPPVKEAEAPAPAPAEPKKKSESASKKNRPKGPPGGIAMWMIGGSNRPRTKQAPKAEKKPEPPPQQ
ncbi:hypothetical protein NUU61_000337 [Penicillium alfredii]|uniref:Ubiquitin-like domain-containing protein n=1 Tax=Penicillium alfredii TaxID=1506179 RepID=A0A9W9G9I8_9EURO|nr:uncharacterized protein NUU61_000337 [Penicillium alfredii]KAJ5114578.1 hypothetical protein NUU61_000337 [Penicillium alfredii]